MPTSYPQERSYPVQQVAFGSRGLFWNTLTLLMAKPPAIAGDAIAKLVLSEPDRSAMNGALFQLEKRMPEPDKAMTDDVLGTKLWEELARLTCLDDAPAENLG